jgi:hypothetical protein
MNNHSIALMIREKRQLNLNQMTLAIGHIHNTMPKLVVTLLFTK